MQRCSLVQSASLWHAPHGATLPGRVVVQTWVSALHVKGPPIAMAQALFFSWVHCTQPPAEPQTVAPGICAHSGSALHFVHSPSAQWGAAGSVQWASVVHATHSPDALQRCAPGAVQALRFDDVHARHSPFSLQTGFSPLGSQPQASPASTSLASTPAGAAAPCVTAFPPEARCVGVSK